MVYGNFIVLGLWGLVALVISAAIAAKWRRQLKPVICWLNASRSSAWCLLALGCLFHAVLWGGFSQVAIVHDEASYLLQAQTFAQGKWALPAPPHSEFFEQFHVLVDPVLASKYPPGHGVLLALGVVTGLPGIVPILLNGWTGMMIFLLVRRISHGAPALLAWFLFLVAPSGLAFRPSYFSELTTGLLMLVAWWELMNWREFGKSRHLLLLAAVIGWSAITRPLTALAFTIPIGVVVLIGCFRRKEWKPLLGAFALGFCILGFLPLQSAHVTGDATLTPYRHYSEVYFPFDIPGFDKSNVTPLRELPTDMVEFRNIYLPIHAAHTPQALPAIFLERCLEVLHTAWGSWWLVFAPLALVALFRGSKELYFATTSALLLVASYLLFAHPASWVLYYLEAQQVIVALAAIGLWRAVPFVLWFVRRGENVVEDDARSQSALATVLFLVAMLPFAFVHFRTAMRRVELRGAAQTQFRDELAKLPDKSIVFVRYKPDHDIHTSLITNVPDLEKAHAWTVYDRGELNPLLLQAVPGRRAYIYEELSGIFYAMDPVTGGIGN